MMEATHHRLEGLEPDNLLAFLALLGLLRALDTARPGWHARAYWDTEHPPLRPMLVVAEQQTEEVIAQAASEGVAALATVHVFDRRDLSFVRAEAREVLLTEEDPCRRALFESLMSDGAVRDDDRVWPTPLCFLFGQGHQHFLDRLAEVPAGKLPAKLRKQKKPPDLTASDYLARALFAPWTREDPTDGFRWDPAEDRRYALRAEDPSGDPAGAQHGANRLAAIALPLLLGTVVRRRSETRFLSLMTSYGGDSMIRFTWPVWTNPASLTAVQALLSHPELAKATPDLQALKHLGVAQIMRAARISVGKFFNSTWAELLATAERAGGRAARAE